MTKQTFLYLEGDGVFVIKLVGELRFMFAPTLEQGLKQLREKMVGKDVIIDFTEVEYADSTILGILTGFFIREEEHVLTVNKAPTIVCNDKDMQKILSNIGFDKYFNLKDTDTRINRPLSSFRIIDEVGTSKEGLDEYVKDAHQLLKEMNDQKSDHDMVIKSFKE